MVLPSTFVNNLLVHFIVKFIILYSNIGPCAIIVQGREKGIFRSDIYYVM
jgi:hypothetical protein